MCHHQPRFLQTPLQASVCVLVHGRPHTCYQVTLMALLAAAHICFQRQTLTLALGWALDCALSILLHFCPSSCLIFMYFKDTRPFMYAI
jgi:hypothetical protein